MIRSMMINCRLRRRQLLLGAATCAAVLAITVVMPVASALAQKTDRSGHNHGPAPEIKDVPVSELANGGALPDVAIGKPDARITIIEYASLTCSHCGIFHRELLPAVKKKYIDTGVARLIVRDFPLENVAAAAAMIARCAGPDKSYDVLSVLFDRQQQWLVGDDVRIGLVAIAKEFGMSEKDFDACLADRDLLQKIADGRTRAHKVFGVRSTPTFFINGKALVGPTSIAQFDAIIEPLLKAK